MSGTFEPAARSSRYVQEQPARMIPASERPNTTGLSGVPAAAPSQPPFRLEKLGWHLLHSDVVAKKVSAMKPLARLVTACCAVLLLISSASGQAPSRPYLQGKWEGVMHGIGPRADGSTSELPPFDPSLGEFGFRLDIRATNLVMYFQNGEQWIGLGEGLDLRTNEMGRSAIVIAALPAPNGGRETMMLNIGRWNEDTIAVFMTRVTGAGPNGDAPSSISAMGIFNRANF